MATLLKGKFYKAVIYNAVPLVPAMAFRVRMYIILLKQSSSIKATHTTKLRVNRFCDNLPNFCHDVKTIICVYITLKRVISTSNIVRRCV